MNDNEWKTNPVHTLRRIRRLSNPNQEIDDYSGLVRELHAIADQCLGNVDLIDITSNQPIDEADFEAWSGGFSPSECDED